MSIDKKDNQSPLIVICIFLFFIVSLLTIAFFYYQFQKERIVQEKQNELTAIADLKVMQITQWRNERLGDAKFISENSLVTHQIESFFHSPKGKNQKNEILSWLYSFQNSMHYKSAAIYDTTGNVRLSTFPYLDSLKSNVRALVKEVALQKKAILSDIQRPDDSTQMNLFLVTPLLVTERQDTTLIGILVISIDPYELLFPLIKIWPTPSRSSETLLFEQDGNDVVYLNELRYYKNTESTLRLPISTEHLPAAMAVRRIEGVVEGRDYRGVPVFAALRQITNSPWFLVTKIDQEEISALLQFQAWSTIGAIIILILASSIFLGLWWRNQRVFFYKRQYQAKVDRLAFLKHFEYLVKYANDIIILANEKLEIIEVNDRTLEVYGYTHDEMLALCVKDLHVITPDELPEQLKTDIELDGATYETINQRKDGSTFPVELSVRHIEVEGKKYYQGIGRDITERKEAEKVLKESEEKFRTLAEQSPNMIFINYNGKVVYANAKCEEQVGYTKEEFYAPDFDFLKITSPEYVGLLKEAFNKHAKGEEVPAYEYAIMTKLGKRIDVIITPKLIPYENGKAILGIITDITERKKAEESLLKFRLGIERSSDAIFITDPIGNIIFVNPGFEQLYGYNFQEAVGNTPRILKSGIHSSEMYKNFWSTLLSKKVVSGEIVNKTKDGRLVHIEGTNNPILDDQNRIMGFLGIHRDITKRKQEEKELQQSFSLIQATLESTTDGILVVDLAGNITNYNTQFVKIWNIPENIMAKGDDREAINFVLAQLKFPNEFVSKVNDLYSHPENESFDVLEFKDGKIFERYSRPQRINGQPVGRVWSFRDVTMRRRAEEQLQESEERYRRLVEYSPDAIAVHSEGKFIYVNPAAMKLIGATDESQLIGMPLMNVIHPDSIEVVRQRVNLGATERKALPPMEEKFIRLDGVVIDVEVTSLPIIFQGKPATLVVTRNITEQKKLQNQFFQSQKILSIGTLAGGIAHDFNNILAIILGYSSTLEKHRNNAQKHADGIAAISQAIDRGAALVRQILTFARKTDIAIEPLSIPTLIRELLSMLKETFSKTITFTQTYAPDLPDILGDRTQIHQAILNLCVNARDAMPNGGLITIKVEKRTKKEVSKRFPTADQESYVCISVSDTGAGIDEVIYSRVFDPFFTTKEKGKGTGLGLSVVYGVMQSHHGFVDIESRIGKGTTFYLFFPVSHMPDKPTEEISTKNEKPVGGTETILLVEDEFLILKAIRRLLKSYGYHVYVAVDGEEAIEVFERHQDEIDLVLSDFGLPKMSGMDVFKKLKEMDPQIKVILASGFFEPDLKFSLQQLGVRGFIQKPYLNNEVLRKLRDFLDEKIT